MLVAQFSREFGCKVIGSIAPHFLKGYQVSIKFLQGFEYGRAAALPRPKSPPNIPRQYP